MTDAELEAKANEFIAAEPKQRIMILRALNKDDEAELVQKTADLGYEPSITYLQRKAAG